MCSVLVGWNIKKRIKHAWKHVYLLHARLVDRYGHTGNFLAKRPDESTYVNYLATRYADISIIRASLIANWWHGKQCLSRLLADSLAERRSFSTPFNSLPTLVRYERTQAWLIFSSDMLCSRASIYDGLAPLWWSHALSCYWSACMQRPTAIPPQLLRVTGSPGQIFHVWNASQLTGVKRHMTGFSHIVRSDLHFQIVRAVQITFKNTPNVVCIVGLPSKVGLLYTVWVKKIPLKFSDIFPQRLGIFSPNFTRQLHVPIYAGLIIFIQLDNNCNFDEDMPH